MRSMVEALRTGSSNGASLLSRGYFFFLLKAVAGSAPTAPYGKFCN